MKEKIKSILIVILIGIIAFPTITLGGSFVVSLIQGKSVEEAIQILAEQIDNILSRLEIIESKQVELETKQTEQERLEACNFMNTALSTAQLQGGIIDADIKTLDELIAKIIFERDNSPQDQYQMWQSRLEKVQILKEQYSTAKTKCEGRNSE